MPPYEENIVSRVMENTQNTHSKSAQASAARLLIILRKRFFPKQDFTNNTTNDCLSEREKNYLNSFIDSILDGSPEPQKIKANHIQGILQFIEYIRTQELPPFNDAEKQKNVLEEIKRLVNLGVDHWTQNQIFDATTQNDLIIDASLGETLNLVSLALLGDTVNEYENIIAEDKLVEEKQWRVLSLFNNLDALHKKPKCTGGCQHDLLFLLNGVYPEKQKNGEYKRIQLVEDLKAFLHELMQTYLSDALKKKHENNPQKLFLLTKNWLLCIADADMSISTELSEWLESQVTDLAKHLNSQCLVYGLKSNDSDKAIQDCCDYIISVSAPDGLGEYVPVFREILLAKINDDTEEIDQSRNAALRKMQELIKTTQSYEDCREHLKRFLQAESFYKRVKKYSRMRIFIGEVEDNFKNAIKSLCEALTLTFNYLANSNVFSEEEDAKLIEAQRNFSKQEKTFTKEHNIDFIINLFSLLQEDITNWDSIYRRIKIENKKSSLLLTDEMIHAVLNRVNTSGVVDITPYEVNRILIHAILTFNKSQHWSDTFKFVLTQIARWILSPNNDESHLTKSFRASYPKSLLSDIYLMSLTCQISWCRNKLVNQLNDENKLANDEVSLPTIFDMVESEDKAIEIYQLVKNNILLLIQNGFDLAGILSCKYLTRDIRDEIWEETKDSLPLLTMHVSDFIELMSCEFLNDDQSRLILQTFTVKLPYIIGDVQQLMIIFDCELLDANHHRQIWQLIKTHLNSIVINFDDYSLFLNHFNLSSDERFNDVWNEFQSSEFKSDHILLIRLLKNKSLSKENHLFVWRQLKPNLKILMQLEEFQSLIESSKLTNDELLDVWNTLLDIEPCQYDEDLLSAIFQCEQIDRHKRTQLLQLIQPYISNYSDDLIEDIQLNLLVSSEIIQACLPEEIFITHPNFFNPYKDEPYQITRLRDLCARQADVSKREIIELVLDTQEIFEKYIGILDEPIEELDEDETDEVKIVINAIGLIYQDAFANYCNSESTIEHMSKPHDFYH